MTKEELLAFMHKKVFNWSSMTDLKQVFNYNRTTKEICDDLYDYVDEHKYGVLNLEEFRKFC